MVEKSSNKPNKRFITEEDTAILLQKYSATTVLALLQEVAHVGDVKIDWNKMVRKTETGITNAREYQMLWRHLAYQDSLLDGGNHEAQPLDDESDLECELEAFPAVSNEASAEASACVKVLIASGLSNDAHGTNGTTMKAPLTINIPQSHAFGASSMNHQCSGSTRGKNITIPISVHKHPLASLTSSENGNITGPATGNGANKRKRRWSEQEDQELYETVQKHGEGNWASLIKGPYKTDRTAAQLSQRWSFIKKKQGNMNVGAASQLSEKHLATRHAVLCALGPMGDNLKSVSSVKAGTSSHGASASERHVYPSIAESPLVGLQSRFQSQQDPLPSTGQCPAASGSLKSRVPSKKPLTKMSVSPDSMVKATAVAAGARIATPSDAATHLKAAQSKNVVHIKSGGGSMMKPSMPGNVNQLPSNVHFIRTGLVNKPPSTHACMTNSSQEPLAKSVKSEIATVKSSPDDIILGLGVSSQLDNGATSNLTSKLDDKAISVNIDVSAGYAARVLGKDINNEAGCSMLMPEASGPQAVSITLTGQDQMDQPFFLGNNLKGNLNTTQNSSMEIEAKEIHGKGPVSVSGRDMKDVQSSSLPKGDSNMLDHCQGNENGASLVNGTNHCGDITKDINGAEKLDFMDVTDVK